MILVTKFSFFLSLILLFTACSVSDDSKFYMTENKVGEKIKVNINKANYVLCFIGDTGYDKERIQTHANSLNQMNCDEIHNLGDLIYERGVRDVNDSGYDIYFKEPFQVILDAKTPYYLTFGNHDYYGNAMVWFEKVKKESSLVFPSSYYYIEYNIGLCMFNLDTNHQYIDQINWFKRISKTKLFKRRCRYNIFKAHHPYKSSGRHGNAKDFTKDFLEQIIKFQSSIFISGHDHMISYEGKFGDAHQFISGSFAKKQASLPVNNYFTSNDYGMIKVIIETSFNDPIKVEIYKMEDINNPVFQKLITL